MEEITKRIEMIINEKVTEKVTERIKKIGEREDDFNDLISIIKSMVSEGEDFYSNIKEISFSGGMIEVEGYLRFGRTLLEYIKDFENE